MRVLAVIILLACFFSGTFAQAGQIRLVEDDSGTKLTVNGDDFMINGMNWDYYPIGTNYEYSLWSKSDEIIRTALDEEMSHLRDMGVNVIRQYTGVPARWITYIYENYGIYTMLNHSFGRYGLTLDGNWVANTEYSEPMVHELLLQEVQKMAQEYENCPGLLLYLLGNENNYGLFWEGAETEEIPTEDHSSYQRARHMYKLFNEAALLIKAHDQSHPVAICNGDLQFLEIIVEECPDFDIFGTNMYRGVSFGDAFNRVKNEYGKPIMFTEFGADAFNAITKHEDQLAQAYYMVGNWQEIYNNAAGLSGAGNSIGGFTFQFSDGWWKFGQTWNLETHDNNASWPNGGYARDFEEGVNNMNEEWFGICAKGATNEQGLYHLYPRAAYYALQQAHRFNPYHNNASTSALNAHFNNIQLTDAVSKARADKAALENEQLDQIRNNQSSNRPPASNKQISRPGGASLSYEAFFLDQGFDHTLLTALLLGRTANVSKHGKSEELNQEDRNWKLVWSDEFEGPAGQSPDPTKWTYDLGTGQNGWGNRELQYYTGRPENVSLDGTGNLIITAQKEAFAGSNYTSARIKTQGLLEQTYGRFEAKIKTPYGPGMWPAFWLLGANIESLSWPQCGEIDIMELRGQEPNIIHGSVHGPGYSAGKAITESNTLTNGRYDTDFQIFAVEWGPDFIDFFVDEVLYQRISPKDVSGEWVYDHDFFMILNLAVGGDFIGPPTSQTTFPQKLQVAWVKVFERSN